MAKGKRSSTRGKKRAVEEYVENSESPAKRVKTGEETEAKVEEKKDENAPLVDSFPIFDNKVMHLCVQKGDIANRTVICEDSWRAWKLARYFDNPNKCIYIHSPRHFECYTGLFQGVPITVIASGMGTPMIDFAVRECKFVIDGPMAISRFGGACSISKDVKVGNVILSNKGGFNVQVDYDKIHDETDTSLPYKISPITKPDQTLTKHLKLHLEHSTQEGNFKTGMTGTTDSFYGSQCRKDDKFDDRNEHLYEAIIEQHPEADCLQMENYCIYALSNMARNNDVYAASVSIAVVNMFEGDKVLAAPKQTELEDLVGYSIFKALADFDFPEGEPAFTVEMINNVKKEEAKRSGGWNKPLPFDRLKSKNPGLFE